MKTKSKPARNAGLSLVPAHTPEFRAPHNLGIDQTIETASLVTALRLNSCVTDVYTNAFWFAAAFGYLVDAAAQTFRCSMELQIGLLNLLVPYTNEEVEALQVAPPIHMASSGNQAPEPEEVERSMDIAIGARAA